jgi:hypothetical protein
MVSSRKVGRPGANATQIILQEGAESAEADLEDGTAIEILGQGVQTRVFKEILAQLGSFLGGG